MILKEVSRMTDAEIIERNNTCRQRFTPINNINADEDIKDYAECVKLVKELLDNNVILCPLEVIYYQCFSEKPELYYDIASILLKNKPRHKAMLDLEWNIGDSKNDSYKRLKGNF